MDADFHERVRERAHQLWLQEGCPEGRGEEHWRQAQRDILENLGTSSKPANQPVDVASTSAVISSEEQFEAQVPPAWKASTLPDVETSPTPSTPLRKNGTTLLKVGLRQCRYIISETYSPAICCGAPTAGGSWCDEHRARVLVRVPVRPSSQPNQRQPSPL